MSDRRKQREGLYRIRYPGGLDCDVRTREVDGIEELTIGEKFYRARGYQPPFEDLPWERDYMAAQKRERAKTGG
jgi:hypothetical protein